MLAPLSWLKDYVDIDVPVKTLAEDMTRVGNEYDFAGNFIDATNLVIGEIKECEEHPDSDHLHVCQVDVGDEVLQIVCGAPNARKGLKVIVALPGAVLPGDFTIKKGNIRGVESNGMMCSMAELGLESKFLTEADKEGIHELPLDAPVGKDPIKFMEMDDGVIDFELTANRGDLLSILGMAYEVGAIYNKEVNTIHPTQKPIKLLEYLIKTYTRENYVVLDNCMGSGSTGVACANTNRRFIGIELDKNYFENFFDLWYFLCVYWNVIGILLDHIPRVYKKRS